MANYPNCIGNIQADHKPIRYITYRCLLCEYNFVCAYLSGKYVPVEMPVFIRRCFDTDLSRKQTISYVRDHYKVKASTANDAYRVANNNFLKFYVAKRPYKKAYHVQDFTAWVKTHLPPFKTGFPKKVAVSLLSRLSYRTSACYPFVSFGAEILTMYRFFAQTYMFDNYPRGSEFSYGAGTFYPVRFDKVPAKQYSTVIINMDRCLSLDHMEALQEAIPPARPMVERTLPELLYWVPEHEWVRSFPVEDVVNHYTNGTPVIVLWTRRREILLHMFHCVQNTLSENYFFRDAFNYNDYYVLFIAKAKGGEKNA